MARPQSPLVGYNTNVRHKGRLYHIQTEDSGVNHPHVITHLFADGGRIIASRKSSYADQLGSDDLSTLVRKVMQDQHKAVFIELRDCVYDEDEHDTSAAAHPKASPQPEVTPPAGAAIKAPEQSPAGAAVKAPEQSPAGAAVKAPEQSPARAAVSSPAPQAPQAPQAQTPMPVRSDISAPVAQEADAQADMEIDVEIDVSALEAAAEVRAAESVAGRARSLAPKRGAGRYQQTVPADQRSRPPSSTRKKESIFGGELLQGKSLDEVILSYLSDDLGEG